MNLNKDLGNALDTMSLMPLEMPAGPSCRRLPAGRERRLPSSSLLRAAASACSSAGGVRTRRRGGVGDASAAPPPAAAKAP